MPEIRNFSNSSQPLFVTAIIHLPTSARRKHQFWLSVLGVEVNQSINQSKWFKVA